MIWKIPAHTKGKIEFSLVGIGHKYLAFKGLLQMPAQPTKFSNYPLLTDNTRNLFFVQIFNEQLPCLRYSVWYIYSFICISIL